MIGKYLIFIGFLLIIIGVVFVLAPKVPLLGKLPGDFYIKRDNFVLYFPLATSLVLSLVLSLIVYLISRL